MQNVYGFEKWHRSEGEKVDIIRKDEEDEHKDCYADAIPE